jgi:hypothetical protein
MAMITNLIALIMITAFSPMPIIHYFIRSPYTHSLTLRASLH